jgi:copper chaperone
MSTIELKIPSMACSACAETITKAVKALDDSATIQADLTTKLVSITSTQAEPDIKSAIAAAGYAVDA